MHRALQLIGTGKLKTEIDASRSTMTGLHASITDIDATIDNRIRMSLRIPTPSITSMRSCAGSAALERHPVPAHRQSPFAGNRLHMEQS